MKCEPSHHVVWHNMHRKTAIFQRPETTPPMPAYHTSPKTIEKRIVWQTERVIRAGRPLCSRHNHVLWQHTGHLPHQRIRSQQSFSRLRRYVRAETTTVRT